MRRFHNSSPRVKLHSTGKTTLTGINYRHLESILTQAALHNYETLKTCKEGSEREEYARNMLKLIECTQASLKEAISATHPKREKTIADRRAEVLEERNTRVLIDSLLDLL
jgi:hypothetical protein